MELRELRRRRYLTMRRLAEMAGLSLATIRDLESGRHRPSFPTCEKLAMALGITPDDIDECRALLEVED
jgi:transcriptional regulator with XRE-family HTH domain